MIKQDQRLKKLKLEKKDLEMTVNPNKVQWESDNRPPDIRKISISGHI